MKNSLIKRLSDNPLISPSDVLPWQKDFEVIGTFNAGVTRYGDEIFLLIRVAERPRDVDSKFAVAPIWNAERGQINLFRVRRDDIDFAQEDERTFCHRGQYYLTSISHLRVARSKDGVHFSIDVNPAVAPAAPTESFGVEDARITKIGAQFWITYKAVSDQGIATALAQTDDFRTFTRHGLIFCPENLDVVVFPDQFNGQYVAWTRPVGRHLMSPTIWMARSPDLLYWGDHQPVLEPRPGMWDCARVGSSCVPFKTPRGWIEIYHGANTQDRYCIGAVLIDADDPSKVIARSHQPLMKPQDPYEVNGFFDNVVFPCGADVRPNGEIMMYYGAADETTCAARTTVGNLMSHLAL